MNIEAGDGNDRTALIWSCIEGHSNVIQFLLKNNANIDQMDNDGLNAFMWACREGHVDIVKMLLEQPTCNLSLSLCLY